MSALADNHRDRNAGEVGFPATMQAGIDAHRGKHPAVNTDKHYLLFVEELMNLSCNLHVAVASSHGRRNTCILANLYFCDTPKNQRMHWQLPSLPHGCMATALRIARHISGEGTFSKFVAKE